MDHDLERLLGSDLVEPLLALRPVRIHGRPRLRLIVNAKPVDAGGNPAGGAVSLRPAVEPIDTPAFD